MFLSSKFLSAFSLDISWHLPTTKQSLNFYKITKFSYHLFFFVHLLSQLLIHFQFLLYQVMAEAVPFGIATNILMKLGSSTFQEIGSIYGVNKELRKLESTLSTIKAALLDAEEKQERSYLVKDWIKKLKDVVYDADDLLDAFETKALQRQLATQTRIKEQVSEFFSSSNQFAFRYKMCLKIRDIRERLDDIAADMSKFNFRERVVEMQDENREREQTHSFVLTSEIIGREKNKEEIIESLMCSRNQENVSIIPIVGIGGSGKTTLAQLAYNDRRVVSFFERRIWVCVSKYFDVKMIVARIVKSVTKSDPGNIDIDQLQICLREHLDGKRYLLVLDDVWNESHERWDCLKNLLMVGAYGSKVIVTTRSRKVASVMGINCPYVLEGLTEDQCWNLFKNLAFGGREGVHPSLIEIGKEIVRRCKGVPLAVRSLGSVMQSKTEESEWLSIQNNEIWRSSLDEYGILPVLKLSYDHLPIHLRQCFAYCSIFPKDYIIQKDMLIQLWIAQGYIHSASGNRHLEEIGDQYFKDLLTRSFFQEAETDYGNGQSFHMHDLIHDLAQMVSGTDCSIAGVDTQNISERVHHMSLQYPFCPSWEVPRNLLEAKGIRTFFLPSYCGLTDESAPDKLMSNSKRLRVLDLHHSCIKKLPDSVGKLKHLRYLDLSDNGEMERLPCCISNLHNLQTLTLSNCKNLRELPSDIRKLISLRSLMIEGCDRLTHMPAGLGKLTSLRTLPRFIVAKNKDCFPDSGKLNELNVLNNLRGEVRLENLENVTDAALESKDSNLKEKRSLRSLNLNWGPSEGSESQDSELLLENLQPHRNLRELCVEGYRGKRFSSWLSLLHNLDKLTIKKCRQCHYLPPLHHLSSLKVLNLEQLTDLEYIDDSSSEPSSSLVFFPSLRELSLIDLPNLKRWWKREAATNSVNNNSGTSSSFAEQQEQQLMLLPLFPRLSTLKIFHCFSLTSMPLHPYLEQLHLYEVSEKLLQQQSTMMMMTMTMTFTMMMMMMATLQSPTGSTTATTSSLSPSSYPSSSSSSLPPCSFSASPLSKLRSLQIERIEDLESLPEEWLPNLSSLELLKVEQCPQLWSLPQEGFRALTSLRSLRIYRCEGLMSLSGGIHYLTALEELKIRSCEELDLSDDGMQLQGLGRLCSVELSDLPKLVALPNWLQHIPTLKELMIEDLHGLTTLPDWIGSLKSLQCLKISFCQGLTSFPERMRSLTALQQLNICNCPRLTKGCRKPTGVDWPKISHIPIIKTDRKWIQGRT